MDVWNDIVEVEACLVAESSAAPEALRALRALCLARHRQRTGAVQPLLTALRADGLHVASWTDAEGFLDRGVERQAAELSDLLARQAHKLGNDALATLQQLLPELYDRALEALSARGGARECAELRQQVQALERTLAAQQEECRSSESVRAHVDSELNAALHENERLAQFGHALQQQVRDLQKQQQRADELEHLTAELLAAKRASETSKDTLAQEADALRKAVADLERRNAVLAGECRTIQRELRSAEQQMQSQQEDIEVLQRAAPPSSAPVHFQSPPRAAADPAPSISPSPRAAPSEHTSELTSERGGQDLDELLSWTPTELPNVRCSRTHAAPLQASPSKRAAPSPVQHEGEVQSSPLKRRAHAFGRGDDTDSAPMAAHVAPADGAAEAGTPSPRAHASVPPDARELSANSGRHLAVSLSDLPLTQQPGTQGSGGRPPPADRAAAEPSTADAAAGPDEPVFDVSNRVSAQRAHVAVGPDESLWRVSGCGCSVAVQVCPELLATGTQCDADTHPTADRRAASTGASCDHLCDAACPL